MSAIRLRSALAVAAAVSIAVLAGQSSRAGVAATPPAPTPKTGSAPWPAPPDPMRRTRLAGLVPEPAELLAYHVHSHLDVFVNGRAVQVPAGIGINIHDPGVHRFDTPIGAAYGGISLCDKPCISPLHTHDRSGVLHTESATPKPNRLGQLFTEWGVRLDASCVGGYCRPPAAIAVYVNGKRYAGDPRAIGLADHREIAIVIGSPPKQIPASYDFSNA